MCVSVLKISKYVAVAHHFWKWGILGEVSFIIKGMKSTVESSVAIEMWKLSRSNLSA